MAYDNGLLQYQGSPSHREVCQRPLSLITSAMQIFR